MNDLISRQAAIDFIAAGHLCNPNEPRWSDNEVVNFLKSRPSAQRTGRWIDDELMCKARCSVCGEEFSWMDNDMDRFWFCPNCGSYNGVEHE